MTPGERAEWIVDLVVQDRHIGRADADARLEECALFHIHDAIAAEREACARVVDLYNEGRVWPGVAAAIRARSNKEVTSTGKSVGCTTTPPPALRDPRCPGCGKKP